MIVLEFKIKKLAKKENIERNNIYIVASFILKI